jgi:lysine N6-hydroxylase
MNQFGYVGIGAGPSGLSLAALAQPVRELNGASLEAQSNFRWHTGIMLPEVRMQTSFLKDLVTLVDSTSDYSFLNFLVSSGRIYRSLIANQVTCSRIEYEQYLRWVADKLTGIHWGHTVKAVALCGDVFEITCENGWSGSTRNLVLASGREPDMPDFATVLRGPAVMHSSEIMTASSGFSGKDVLVVGGGQSAAEVVRYLLQDDSRRPASLIWASSSIGFRPIDDSPFTNEWFMPPYAEYFTGLSAYRRQQLLREQRLASDGVTESVLKEIYGVLYQIDIADGARFQHALLAGHRVIDLSRDQGRLLATLEGADLGRKTHVAVDAAIFCTGYRRSFPHYLEPIRDRLVDDSGQLHVRPDFSLDWDGPDQLRIYAMNFADQSHGVADRNLSVISWRSAKIINAMAGREIYRLDRVASTMAWSWTSAFDDQLDFPRLGTVTGDV